MRHWNIGSNPQQRDERHRVDRRPVDRPVRQDPAARGRPPRRARLPDGDRAVRRAGALARARPHLPADPARPVERARRRPRRREVVDALLQFSRYPVPHALLVDVADTMDRYGRLQLVKDPAHGLVLRGLDRAVLTRSPSRRSSPACSAPASTPTRSRCTRPSAAGSSRRCSRSAGRPRTWPATSTARRTRSRCDEDGWTLRAYQQRGGRALLGRRLRRRRAALRRRQDAGRRGRDGRRPGRPR